jgi:Na+-driven multidrug efflux pump
VASSSFLVTENLGRISMYRTLFGLAINVVLNVALIPGYGAMGAAIATVVSYTCATFALVAFPQTRGQCGSMFRAFSPAGLYHASVFMSSMVRKGSAKLLSRDSYS